MHNLSHANSVIELTSDLQSLGIAPGVGGGLSHWRARRGDNWIDVLRPASDTALVSGDPRELSCFPLVPYSNRIRNGRFRFRGRDVQLPLNFGDHPHSIHGFGWQAPWSVIDQCATGLAMEHAVDGQGAWPYAYRAVQTIALVAAGFDIEISVTNLCGEEMPIGLGFHPYFAHPGEATLAADVKSVSLTDDEVMPTAMAPLPGHWNLPSGAAIAGMRCDNLFSGWSGLASIAWRDLGLTLTMQADPVLGHLVVYAPPGKDFFCIEPVSQVTDAFNLAAAGDSDTGMRTLAPGGTLNAKVRFRLSGIQSNWI